MRQAWDPITLTVQFWHASRLPVGGDELRTATGRRYMIQSFDGTKIKAVVLPMDAPACEGCVFRWEWGSRKRK